MLMYPGCKYAVEGPIVSMRLKALRRGLQEYELLEMASELRGRERTETLVNATFPCQPQDWTIQRDRLLALLVG
jgi:hypothetical protein